MQPGRKKKYRLALWFSVAGDIRFLSHRDSIRLWQKALARAQLPTCYSKGFNPRPRLSLPLPRSVAMSAAKELLLIELDQSCNLTQLQQDLQDQLPQGIKIIAARYVPFKVSVLPSWAHYRITLTGRADSSDLAGRLEDFKKAKTVVIRRPAHGRHRARAVDLRACLAQLELHDDALSCTINIMRDATGRIDELLGAFGLSEPALVKEINRIDVGYPPQLSLKE